MPFTRFLSLHNLKIQCRCGIFLESFESESIIGFDANTSIDQLLEDLNIKMPEAFGYIPRTEDSIKVLFEGANEDDNDEIESERKDPKNKIQGFKLEVLAANSRKLSAVQFERITKQQHFAGVI